MGSIRTQRMESLLREHISSLILRNEISDPRVNTMLSVSGISVSKDLVYAKVRISGFTHQNQLEDAVKGLNSAAGFIQQRIGKVLHTKHTPRLTFVADHSIEDGFAVNQSIGELNPGE